MKKKGLFKLTIGFLLILMSVMFVFTPAFAKVIKLTFNEQNAAMTPPGKAIAHWAKEIEKQSEGRVKITVHYAGALLKSDETYRGIQSGIADGGSYILDGSQGFLLNTVISLPFMGWPGQVETAQIYQELLNIPEVASEWKGVKVIGFIMMPGTQIHNKKKVVKTPGDIKGMKFHCAEASLATIVQAAGGTPIEMDISDMYMSLDRGLIDGIVNHFPVLFVFGALKLPSYHTIVGDGGINMTPMMLTMNTDKLKSLPPDIQKIIANSGNIYADLFLKMDIGLQMKCLGDVKQWKHTLTYLSPEEQKQWYDLVKSPVHDKWIETAEAKGLPGQAIYDRTIRLVEKYHKK